MLCVGRRLLSPLCRRTELTGSQLISSLTLPSTWAFSSLLLRFCSLHAISPRFPPSTLFPRKDCTFPFPPWLSPSTSPPSSSPARYISSFSYPTPAPLPPMSCVCLPLTSTLPYKCFPPLHSFPMNILRHSQKKNKICIGAFSGLFCGWTARKNVRCTCTFTSWISLKFI